MSYVSEQLLFDAYFCSFVIILRMKMDFLFSWMFFHSWILISSWLPEHWDDEHDELALLLFFFFEKLIVFDRMKLGYFYSSCIEFLLDPRRNETFLCFCVLRGCLISWISFCFDLALAISWRPGELY